MFVRSDPRIKASRGVNWKINIALSLSLSFSLSSRIVLRNARACILPFSFRACWSSLSKTHYIVSVRRTTLENARSKVARSITLRCRKKIKYSLSLSLSLSLYTCTFAHVYLIYQTTQRSARKMQFESHRAVDESASAALLVQRERAQDQSTGPDSITANVPGAF